MPATIGLTVSEEEDELRATVRRLLADKAPLARTRRSMEAEDPFDRELWRQMAEQVGLQALCVPERRGGLGQGPLQAALVFEEMGRCLYPGPFFATAALATNALVLSSGDDSTGGDGGDIADGDVVDDVAGELLAALASGQVAATLAVPEADGRWDPGRQLATVATPRHGSWALDGMKCFVVDGMAADWLLVSARTDAGTSLFVVDAGAPEVSRRAMTTLDLTRRLASVRLDGASGRLLGTDGGGDVVIDAVVDRALVALAAESVGGMRACLELSVDHAKTRHQFGTPIGAFQAVAHKCVEMLQRSEFGASAVRYAAVAQAQGSDDAGVAARVAAAYCGRGYRWVSAETIQVHGGLGFTWEHDAHLYYRRARSSEQLFGSVGQHLDLIADRVGL